MKGNWNKSEKSKSWWWAWWRDANISMVHRDKALELQAECFAEDIDVPTNVDDYTEQQLVDYFESGGQVRPKAVPKLYEVCHKAAFVREAPSTAARAR